MVGGTAAARGMVKIMCQPVYARITAAAERMAERANAVRFLLPRRVLREVTSQIFLSCVT